MHSGLVPRRRVLSSVAATSLVGLAGCIDDYDGLRYRLYTAPVAGSVAELTNQLVVEDPTTIAAQEAIDYSDAYKQSVVDTLFEEGAVDTVQWQLAHDHSFGTTTRPAPQFVERDGTYYSVTETDQTESPKTAGCSTSIWSTANQPVLTPSSPNRRRRSLRRTNSSFDEHWKQYEDTAVRTTSTIDPSKVAGRISTTRWTPRRANSSRRRRSTT